jgi:hypothetical protein
MRCDGEKVLRVLSILRIGGIVTVVTSLPFVAMCIPIGIFLLIFWLKPETKAFFGLQPPASPVYPPA